MSEDASLIEKLKQLGSSVLHMHHSDEQSKEQSEEQSKDHSKEQSTDHTTQSNEQYPTSCETDPHHAKSKCQYDRIEEHGVIGN
jgi:hypothetical protein